MLVVLNWIKSKLIYIGIIIALIFIFWKLFSKIDTLMYENKIAQNNVVALNTKLETIKLDNGKLLNRIEGITIDAYSLKQINSKLNKRIHDLDLKIKNLQSVSDVGINYKINIDTIVSKKIEQQLLRDSVYGVIAKLNNQYKFNKSDKYMNVNGVIEIVNDTPIITNFHLETTDSLLIAPEIKYKRWWIFWKRPVGVKLNISSTSPYNKIKYINHYNFSDLKK